jgi:hypothetical protein
MESQLKSQAQLKAVQEKLSKEDKTLQQKNSLVTMDFKKITDLNQKYNKSETLVAQLNKKLEAEIVEVESEKQTLELTKKQFA